MRTKWLILGTAVLLAIGAAQMGYGQPGCGFRPGPGFGDAFWFGPGDGPGVLAIAKALDLKPEQIKKIEALRLDLAKATLKLRNDLQLKRLELRQLILADKPDRKQIEAKIDEIAPLRTQLQKKRIEHLLAMRDVLTPEQWAKLQQLWWELGKQHPGGPRGWHRGLDRW